MKIKLVFVSSIRQAILAAFVATLSACGGGSDTTASLSSDPDAIKERASVTDSTSSEDAAASDKATTVSELHWWFQDLGANAPPPADFVTGGNSLKLNKWESLPYITTYGKKALDLSPYQGPNSYVLGPEGIGGLIFIAGTDSNGVVWGTWETPQIERVAFIFKPGKGLKNLGRVGLNTNAMVTAVC